MEASYYSRFLARHPCVIIIVIFFISATSFIFPLTIEKFPDFSDPQLGFEARGTPLAQRLITWKNIIESSNPRGELIDNPLEYFYYLQEINRRNEESSIDRLDDVPRDESKPKKGRRKKKKDGKKNNSRKKNKKQEEYIQEKSLTSDRADYLYESENELMSNEFYSPKNPAGDFFCNEPSSAYSRVVVSSVNNLQNLWSIEGALALCNFDSVLRSSSYFPSLCQRQLLHGKRCCRSWSPVNYIAFLSNRSSCFDITKEDLSTVKDLLQECFYYYRKQDLTSDCSENIKCQRRVPPLCYSSNAVYHLLHYLVDADFLVTNDDNVTNSVLSSAMIILPIAASSASLDYYYDVSIANLTHGEFHISAMQLGLKSTLFDRLLISESIFLLFGFAFVTICIWLYTGSLLITISAISAIIMSLGISYTVYTFVLRINHFPFMNLLTIVVAVGIGSDDAFIFCKIWESNKRKKSLSVRSNLLRLVNETMKHAVPAMFVTTLTTSVAFFASIVSNVTAINCFSLFSGMTVIANFLLMITWFPASVILAEKLSSNLISPTNFIARKMIQPVQLFLDRIVHLFTEFLSIAVLSAKWLWFIIFLILGVGSSLVIYRYPGLRLPDSPSFQLFDSSHLFEQYDLFHGKRFAFEKLEQSDEGSILPLRFVWGVLPVDNGNYLNPESRGTLVYDESFNITARESQVWLQDFCKSLRLQPFYRSTLGPLLPNCFIESLQPWMERSCEDPVDPSINRSPCCKDSVFPYNSEVLTHCSAEAIAELHRTPSHLWNFRGTTGAQTAGPKFRKQNVTKLSGTFVNNSSGLVKVVPEIQVVIVEYDSNFTFSLSYSEMDKFFHQVENWMQNQLLAAPPGMKNGWFVSYLEFYELQRTLYEGTIWAIVLSMGLALSVLALVTLNPFVSLYAILAIGAAIIVTVAILVLIGWKLNVLESVAVSTAIGLATDFSLHYSVSYRVSATEHRVDRVKTTLEQMGGPTLMAALTTSAAGALMLPSHVLAYIQIGIFLVIIMGVSWIYATFFLCPMLAIAGPTSYFAHFKCLRFRRTLVKENERVKETKNRNSSNKVSEEENGIPLESILNNQISRED